MIVFEFYSRSIKYMHQRAPLSLLQKKPQRLLWEGDALCWNISLI